MKTFKKIIEELTKRGETIATMESCTGGGVADAITSIEGASEVLKFSAVTYSNEYKIKMGVSKDVIDTYSVYSMETAHEIITLVKIMKYLLVFYIKISIMIWILMSIRRVVQRIKRLL